MEPLPYWLGTILAHCIDSNPSAWCMWPQDGMALVMKPTIMVLIAVCYPPVLRQRDMWRHPTFHATSHSFDLNSHLVLNHHLHARSVPDCYQKRASLRQELTGSSYCRERTPEIAKLLCLYHVAYQCTDISNTTRLFALICLLLASSFYCYLEPVPFRSRLSH